MCACVCVCVYVCACVYVCMYVVCMYGWMDGWMDGWIDVHTHTHTHTHYTVSDHEVAATVPADDLQYQLIRLFKDTAPALSEDSMIDARLQCLSVCLCARVCGYLPTNRPRGHMSLFAT